MKKENEFFFKNLEKNYIKLQEAQNSKNPNEISKNSLFYLSKISEIISEKYGKGKENEEKAIKILQKFSEKNPEIKNFLKEIGIKNGKIPTFSEVINKIIFNVANILDEKNPKIKNIYKKNARKIGIEQGSGSGFSKLKNYKKYETLIKVLNKNGIIFENIKVITEEITNEAFRKTPYKIVYILGKNPKTITICDEAGQATYIFDGYIEAEKFLNSGKGENIDGINPIKINYSEKHFEQKLTEILFSEDLDLETEKLKYFKKLKKIIPELQKIGLEIEKNGNLNFKNLKGSKFWPKVSGKLLISFPNTIWNKKNKIGNEKGLILGKKDLAKLFELLGFSVNKNIFLELNKENEKNIYKSELEKIITDLVEIGLEIDKNGDLNFENLKENNFYNFEIFQNKTFNKKNKIGNKEGIISNKKDLANFFYFLGFNINKNIFKNFKNLEDEKNFYKSELEKIIPDLVTIGLEIEKNGNLNFKNLKGSKFWPKVSGKLLISFPNTIWNKKNKIGNKKGLILGKKDLAKLFELLGFSVNKNIFLEENNLENEKNIFKSEVENILPDLVKIGLEIEQNGNLNFENLKGSRFWPTINGKKLLNYPNSIFNKKYKIGNKNGIIKSRKELAYFFEFLGFSVNKNIFLELNEENEKNFYKSELEKIIPDLVKIGLKIEKNGNLNFKNLKGFNNWPKINKGSLVVFPSTTFNKKHKIGNLKGIISNKKDLAKLFKFFGFPVEKNIFSEYSLEEKIKLYNSEMKNFIPELQKIGLKIEENGNLNLENLQGYMRRPKVNGRRLTSFPNFNFNKNNGIGNKDGAIQNKKELAKLFELLGFSVNKNIFLEFSKKEDCISELTKIIPELQKIGLKIEKNGNLNFKNLKGEKNWPTINGKKISYFPSLEFNRENNIGIKDGMIQSKKDLAKLFEIFEFPVEKNIF